MATFVLIPGAGGVAWYWHLVADLLVDAGHEAIAVDLPADDANAGLADYADRVADAIDRRRDVVLVAQSLGGFTAPLVCARVPVEKLVFVNAMIPITGELVGAWWDNTGATEARIAAAERAGYPTDFDTETYFLHDLSPALVAQGAEHVRAQSERVFGERCVFGAWPNVPIHVIAGRDDRFFPVDFQKRVARERLGLDVDVLPGGHLLALANPGGVAGRLLSY
jgi:pimeloyl-ACP methyl ester carboxylesterase